MRYKLIGKSGLRVSELCLGTMTFGPEWGWGADKDESRKIFNAYVEAGGNFIDTANRYTEGTSETYLGEFMASRREQIVLATKYTLYMRKGDPNSAGNQRKNMVQSVEASLKRLKADYIDLYWVHAFDYMTPVDEIMRGLDDLVRAGKVLYVGISDTPAWIVAQANTMAELRGWSQFVGLQIEYSLIERTVERELLPMARAFDLTVTPWGIIGGGVLTGKYADRKAVTAATHRYADPASTARINERNLAIGDTVVKIAKEMGCSPANVATNWIRQQPGQFIPILGVRSAAQLKENLACLDHSLSKEQLDELDRQSAVDLGFPHKFVHLENIRELIYAGMFDHIDNHHRQ